MDQSENGGKWGLAALPKQAARFVRSPIGQNTLWMLLARAIMLGSQAVYFVIIARSLGPAGFGEFSASLALVYVLVPFASWGGGKVMIMHAARDRGRLPAFLGNSLLTVAMAGSVCTLVIFLLRLTLLANLSMTLLMVLAVGELLFGRVHEVAFYAFQAVDRLGVGAIVTTLPFVMRLAAALAFLARPMGRSAEAWAWFYGGATLAASAIAIGLVSARLTKPAFDVRRLDRRWWKEGFYFALGLSSGTIYNDADKTLLSQMATLSATGIYSAAYRVIDMAFAPVGSMLQATYARFIRKGEAGIAGSLGFARRLLPFSLGYGGLSALGLLVVAPWLAWLLGDEYRLSVVAIRLMAVVPFLRVIHYLGGDTLTGAGHQAYRGGLQLAVAVMNVVLNVLLIPRFSWVGSVAATIISDLTLGGLTWLVVVVVSRREAMSHATVR